MDPTDLKAIPVTERPVSRFWADFGDEYEDGVIASYRQQGGVKLLAPASGQDFLSEESSLAFVRGTLTDYTAAHQVEVRGTPALRRHLKLDGVEVDFRKGFIDLLLARTEGDRRILRIVDVKSTQEALPFHKAQVAWYAWMLRGLISEHGIAADIDTVGEIWHRPRIAPAEGVTWDRAEFRLRSYESLIQDWAAHELADASRRRAATQQDSTRFHIYYKCEQCKYLDHCGKTIADKLPPGSLDLSAIPGMSQQSKATLHGIGIRTVRDFVSRKGEVLARTSDWTLSSRGGELVARAEALLAGKPERISGHVTLRMPPATDVKVLLVVDRDPMASRLVTVAARVVEGSGFEETVETIAQADSEAGALVSVLKFVWGVLDRVHRENIAGDRKILHLFVYEPAEAIDLADALGRHLDHPGVLVGLLDLVRMFPPEGVLPEPEYRGLHHLPASAIRAVIEDLFALPAKVSYDLRRAGMALGDTSPSPSYRYDPDARFRRPFSSRLPLDAARELEGGTLAADAVKDDVHRRLNAMQSLVAWLENVNASVPAAERFLRLQKAPFRLQATVAPLGFRGLEVLTAQTLLESHGALVGTLHTLAQPLERRIAKQSCISGLQLIKSGEGPSGGHWLLFRAPSRSLDADISPGDPVLLLTDGHPDRVLDRSRWSNFRVEWKRDEDRPGDTVFLTISDEAFGSADFRELFDRPKGAEWVLDRGHFDVTSTRLLAFLRHVDEGSRAS
jgi:hypothetical protein